MKFLFFDTECATCFNGAKICEFGYVLTDDKFRILKKNNLLIDPQTRFNLYGLKRAGITLSYSVETYKKSPTLTERYEEIKKLLTTKNVLPVGYSCDNDARFLLSDIARHKLAAFDYDFLDVLELVRQGLKRDKNLSLDAVYKDTGKEETVHHEALSDALMTMEVLRYYLKQSGKKVKDLLKERYAFGEVFKGRIVTGGKPFKYSASGKMTPQNKRLLNKYLSDKEVVEGALGNKTFCFEKEFEKENFEAVLKTADMITDVGGRYTEIISFADYLIVPEGVNGKYLYKKKRRSARLIGFKELGMMLNTYEKVFYAPVNVDEILAKTPENAEWYKDYCSRKKRKYH